MSELAERNRAKTVLAFAIIYLVWGSTFLAIRIRKRPRAKVKAR